MELLQDQLDNLLCKRLVDQQPSNLNPADGIMQVIIERYVPELQEMHILDIQHLIWEISPKEVTLTAVNMFMFFNSQHLPAAICCLSGFPEHLDVLECRRAIQAKDTIMCEDIRSQESIIGHV